MDKISINWGLMKNPINWVVVLLMVFIASIAFKIISRKLAEKE